MVSREQALARVAALEARTAPIRRKAPHMIGLPAADLAVVVDLDDHRRAATLADLEVRVAALEARVAPIVERGRR